MEKLLIVIGDQHIQILDLINENNTLKSENELLKKEIDKLIGKKDTK